MIRKVEIKDAPLIRDIYSYYVEKSSISFEYEVPSIEEFERRISNTLSFYPYLVYEEDSVILAYAYASRLKERKAYSWNVETSIYVKNGFQRRGIGKELHKKLKEELKKMGILSMYACISAPVDEESNSILFHKYLGYKLCGRFSKCGYKFNSWYDIVWMQLDIGNHKEGVLPPISYK